MGDICKYTDKELAIYILELFNEVKKLEDCFSSNIGSEANGKRSIVLKAKLIEASNYFPGFFKNIKLI